MADKLTQKELFDLANEGYGDGTLRPLYDDYGGWTKLLIQHKSGDGLAAFIIVELLETFEANDEKDIQLQTAIDAMEAAVWELEGVIASLRKEVNH